MEEGGGGRDAAHLGRSQTRSSVANWSAQQEWVLGGEVRGQPTDTLLQQGWSQAECHKAPPSRGR